jgi:hypothetical protein
MFRFKKAKKAGASYQYPVYKYTRGFVGEILGFATFRPAAVDGFGVVPGGNSPLYKKWNVLPESQKESFRLRIYARIAANKTARK